MRGIDLIRAEQYRMEQTENTADSTGQQTDDFAQAIEVAFYDLRIVLALSDDDEIKKRLIRAGARIAQALDILKDQESRT